MAQALQATRHSNLQQLGVAAGKARKVLGGRAGKAAGDTMGALIGSNNLMLQAGRKLLSLSVLGVLMDAVRTDGLSNLASDLAPPIKEGAGALFQMGQAGLARLTGSGRPQSAHASAMAAMAQAGRSR